MLVKSTIYQGLNNGRNEANTNIGKSTCLSCLVGPMFQGHVTGIKCLFHGHKRSQHVRILDRRSLVTYSKNTSYVDISIFREMFRDDANDDNWENDMSTDNCQ